MPITGVILLCELPYLILMIYEVDTIASFQIRKLRIREIKYLPRDDSKWQISLLLLDGIELGSKPKFLTMMGFFIVQNEQEDCRLYRDEHFKKDFI